MGTFLFLNANAEIVIYTPTDPGSSDQDGNRSCGHVSRPRGMDWHGEAARKLARFICPKT